MNSNYPVQRYLQHTPGENYIAGPFFQRFGPHQNIEQRGDTGDPVYTQPQHNLPAPLATTTGNRWQKRGGYLLRHLPYFMHCPLPRCAWRGNRADLFKSHWQQEDHCRYHAYYGRTPNRSQFETYDPWVILNQIKDGVISIHEGKNRANILVRQKAYALQKTKVWADAWSRSFKF